MFISNSKSNHIQLTLFSRKTFIECFYRRLLQGFLGFKFLVECDGSLYFLIALFLALKQKKLGEHSDYT